MNHHKNLAFVSLVFILFVIQDVLKKKAMRPTCSHTLLGMIRVKSLFVLQ